MTDYIRQSLSDDEELIHIARFHWMYNVQAVFNLIFAIIFAIVILILAIKYQPMMFGTASTESFRIC